MKIRKYQTKDGKSILAIEKKVYPKHLVVGKELLFDLRWFEGHKFSYVVEDEGKIVGYMMVIRYHKPLFHLSDICLLPEHQGRGLGKKLLLKLIDLIAKSGDCLLDVHLNKNSLALFDSCLDAFKKNKITLALELPFPNYFFQGETAFYRLYKKISEEKN